MADELRLNIVLEDDGSPEPPMLPPPPTPQPAFVHQPARVRAAGNAVEERRREGESRRDEYRPPVPPPAPAPAPQPPAPPPQAPPAPLVPAFALAPPLTSPPAPQPPAPPPQAPPAPLVPAFALAPPLTSPPVPQPAPQPQQPPPTPAPAPPPFTPTPRRSDAEIERREADQLRRDRERRDRIDRMADPERAARRDTAALPEAEATEEAKGQLRREKADEAERIDRAAFPEKWARRDAGAASEKASAPWKTASELASSGGMNKTAGLLGRAGDLAGAAAGDVVPILAVADAAGKAVAAGFDSIANGARNAGEVGTKLASNDNFGAILKSADIAAEALGKIPIVGAPLEAGLKAVTATFDAFEKVVLSFVERGRQLQGFSPDLAVANATADLRSVVADIREAQELGPGLARLTDAQSRFENTMREILTPLKSAIIDRLIPLVEGMTVVAQGTSDGIRITYALHTAISEAVKSSFVFDREGVAKALKNFGDEMKKILEPKDEALDAIGQKQLDDLFKGRPDIPRPFDPVLGS